MRKHKLEEAGKKENNDCNSDELQWRGSCKCRLLCTPINNPHENVQIKNSNLN